MGFLDFEDQTKTGAGSVFKLIQIDDHRFLDFADRFFDGADVPGIHPAFYSDDGPIFLNEFFDIFHRLPPYLS